MKTQKSFTLIKHMLTSLEDTSQLVEDLSEWEDNFVSSVRQQFENKGDLSDKQFEILERIYARKTA